VSLVLRVGSSKHPNARSGQLARVVGEIEEVGGEGRVYYLDIALRIQRGIHASVGTHRIPHPQIHCR
jgi:hypothetical protein